MYLLTPLHPKNKGVFTYAPKSNKCTAKCQRKENEAPQEEKET